LKAAIEAAKLSGDTTSKKLENCLTEEREQAANDRQTLLAQIAGLINASGQVQDQRLQLKIGEIQQEMKVSQTDLTRADDNYTKSMDLWSKKETKLVEDVLKSRESIKMKLKTDWTAVNEHNTLIQATTKSVHEETVRIVDKQMTDMATQMQALDDFVTRARSQNETYYTKHVASVQGLTSTIRSSFSATTTTLQTASSRIKSFSEQSMSDTANMIASMPTLETEIAQPLSSLREELSEAPLIEYRPTGETPQKVQYHYPNKLPRTAPRAQLLNSLMHSISDLPDVPEAPPSPSKSLVYNDTAADDTTAPITRPSTADGGLREVHINISAGNTARISDPSCTYKAAEAEILSLSSSLMGPPPMKRVGTDGGASRVPRGRGARAEGRENELRIGGRRLRSSPTG
jgi:kinesin family protein 11